MDTHRALAYDKLGESHWWLTGKYTLLTDLLRTQIPRGARLDPMLDVGCSGGVFLKALRGLSSDAFGLDSNPDALRRCDWARTTAGDAARLPYADASFALVSAIDVIEHVENDAQAVGEFHRVLRRDGWLLLCVPAFQALFGTHDELFGHLRRYRRRPLRRLIEDAGFVVHKATYIEPLFFAPLWIKRRWFPGKDPLVGDFSTPPAWLNRALHALLAAERFPLRYVSFPIGATLIALAQKAK